MAILDARVFFLICLCSAATRFALAKDEYIVTIPKEEQTAVYSTDITIPEVYQNNVVNEEILNFDSSLSEKEQFLQKQQARIIELLEDDNAREVIETFLNDVREIMENSNAGLIIVGTLREIRNILNSTRGSASMKYICDTITDVLTNETACLTIYNGLNGVVNTFSGPDTAALIKFQSSLVTKFLKAKPAVDIVNSVGSGIISFTQVPDPKNTIITSFRNLKKFMTTSWSESASSFMSLSSSKPS